MRTKYLMSNLNSKGTSIGKLAVFAIVGMMLSSELLSAISNNEYVTVESTTPGVEEIYAVLDDFYITTRGVGSPPFAADIEVTANSPWYLKRPRSGHLHLAIGENDEYQVGDGSSSEEGPGGRIYVLKLDIEQQETNVCWKSTSCKLSLTDDSRPGGEAVWSSAPAGISGKGKSVTFNPSLLGPGEYTVTAKSGIVPGYKDTCMVRVVASMFVVYVDQPGSGGQRVAYNATLNGIDAGHAFWMYTNSYPFMIQEPQMRVFINVHMGYWPDGVVSLLSPSAPGKLVKPDVTHLESYEVDHSWEVSFTQFTNGLRHAMNLKRSPGTYDLRHQNCVDAVINAGKAVGVSVPDTEGDWLFWRGSNCGDLGEDLRILNGKGKADE